MVVVVVCLNTFRRHRSKETPKRVERAAARDAVGEQIHVSRTSKCTFSGVVPIDLKQFLNSDVTLVECPDCASTRTLEPRNGRIRFQSHAKRKTQASNTVQRWAMEATTWGVVGG